MEKKKNKGTTLAVAISAPNFSTAIFRIKGDAPYVQCKFSEKAKAEIHATQAAGSTSKKGKKKEPKDFLALYEAAMHKSTDGWTGIPAPAFRCAMISACRVCGFQMTRAKLSIFVEADGFGVDGTPLVKILEGEPHYVEHYVRIQQTVDLRVRPMWDPGWEADVRVRFDADQFTAQDIANLMLRVGMQVGVGEGRADSKSSCGMGWGSFESLRQEA